MTELDGDRMSDHIPEAPVAISVRVEKAIIATHQHADEIAVRRLSEVEDARNFGTNRWLPGCGERLLATEQAVQAVPT